MSFARHQTKSHAKLEETMMMDHVPPNRALEPTRITRYDLPMSVDLFDIARPRGSA
jgi:hypothetical protein